MTTTTNSRGGANATRGLLVQTLIALLDITKSDPPFDEITLEPMVGDDQFDFFWKNASGSYATQVKSTEIMFAKATVVKWAKKLERARTNEACTLVLVGNIAPGLTKLEPVGKVTLEQKPLELKGLIKQAAQQLAEFMESEGLYAGTAKERIRVVHAIESKLQHFSTDATILTRTAFLSLLREWITSAPRTGVRVEVSQISKNAPTRLIGRDRQTKLLNDAWKKALHATKKRPRILTFVALGGEGKTSLVAKWAADLAKQGWPGCNAVFAWSFYRQGSLEQTAVSSDLFLAEALAFFGDAEMARSAAGAVDKARRLGQLVGEQRTLLILDGLEPLQYPPTSTAFPPGELKDKGIAELLKKLAADNCGLCVVTTRYSIPDLKAFIDMTVHEIPLPRLSREAGVVLLQSFDVKGSLQRNIVIPGCNEQWNEFEKLVEDVRGHALTLNLLGSYLRDAHGGDIRRRDLVKLEEADAEEQGGHAFRVLDAYVTSFESGGHTAEDQAKGRRALAMLQLMGLFDRPASADCLHVLWSGEAIAGLTEPLLGLSDAQRNLSLKRLESAKLLTVNRDASGSLVSLDAHPLIREYFAKRLQMSGKALTGSDAFRVAHRRLYEHLCATTQDKPDATLEDLQPLYQAVAHGCSSGLANEALATYKLRIVVGNRYHSIQKLGAFGSDLGALRCIAESSGSSDSTLDTNSRGYVSKQIGYCLRALSRFSEAKSEFLNAIKLYRESRDYAELSTLEVMFAVLCWANGDLREGLIQAQHSIKDSDSSEMDDNRISALSVCGHVLNYLGKVSEAGPLFDQVLNIVENSRPRCSTAVAPAISRYCDWLCACNRFDEAYRSSTDWLDCLRGELTPLHSGLLELAVSQALVGCKLTQIMRVDAPLEYAERAVNFFRKSNVSYELVRAYVVRAKLCTISNPELAQRDLDEAWEIAERGPMLLFLADIHLYRARLFGRMKGEGRRMNEADAYPWESVEHDLMEARRLIEKCGYWRRKEELEDAERALLGESHSS